MQLLEQRKQYLLACKHDLLLTSFQTQIRSDIQKYLELYRPEAAAVANEFPIVVVDNGENDQNPSIEELLETEVSLEGDLDGELVLGISWPTSFMSWVTGGEPPFNPDLNTPTDTNEPYLNWLGYVLGQDDLPYVISSKSTASLALLSLIFIFLFLPSWPLTIFNVLTSHSKLRRR